MLITYAYRPQTNATARGSCEPLRLLHSRFSTTCSTTSTKGLQKLQVKP